MAVTAQNLIDKARLHLQLRDEVQTLNEALDASETGVDIATQLGGIQAGAVIAIDQELMLVQSVSSLTATVVRGWWGSTAATHNTGANIFVNPSFSDFQLFQELNNVLDSLPGHGVYQMKSLELTYNAAIDGYNLTGLTDVLDIYAVHYQDTGPQLRWPEVRNWRLMRNAETDDFASGMALILNESAQSGRQLRVIYKAPFVAFTATTTDAQTTVGLAASQNRILPLGVAYNVLQQREARRAAPDRQGDSRRAGEIPPGHQLTAARGFRDLYERAIAEEAAILHGKYPPKRNR